MPEAGESYSAAGVNYERLQEEVLAGEANVKELQPMPSSSTGKLKWGKKIIAALFYQVKLFPWLRESCPTRFSAEHI